MPGRLMAGRMALDHVVKVRVLPGQSFITRRYRLGVRTDGSQPSNRGSNPRSGIFLPIIRAEMHTIRPLSQTREHLLN